MQFDNYTIKSQEAIQKSTEVASQNGHQAIDTGHLLKGIFTVDENVISYIFNKLNVNESTIQQVLDSIILS